MIKYNPLYKNDGTLNGALSTPPSDSIVFDVPGKCIWVKGVKLKGTDTTYTFSHDNYITLTNTPGDPEDIKIGANITALREAITVTYAIVTSALDGLAPRFSTTNFADTSASTAYRFLGIQGSTLKWYSLPHRNIYIGANEVLTVSNSDPLKFAAGNGITLTWNSTNKCIEITNSKPDINHNTDFNVSQYITSSDYDYRILFKRNANDDEETGTVRYSSSLLYNPSSHVFKINGQTAIHTGNIQSSNATIGNTLTTIASLGGVEIKAKVDTSQVIPSYLSQWDISVDKASFELIKDWKDSGVGLQALLPGPCLLYINYCGVHYTGVFAYAGTNINTDDEFPLHESGYSQLGRGRIFAKIASVSGVAKLMIAALVPEENIPLFTIKIKQIAIL